ncbi:2'-5' RNA ligase family protein [Tahibacter caeni]|uniref:2'-5' RNA ligase family protein n=1 Tax=Tahibacter caeni TaxID=1453545 RepID=UPI0021482CC5|nr:2'-5' RNA ligase family protein [Tahibacter caeni]
MAKRGPGDRPDTVDEHPFAAEGGLPFRPSRPKDGLARFFELMEVVQVLSPRWPPRELSQDLGGFLLSGKVPMSSPQDDASVQSSLFGNAPLVPTDRLFLGLYPDAATAARIDALGAEVCARHGIRGPRHQPGRLHITLFHIGDWAGLPTDTVEAARTAAASLRAVPFPITLDEVASFSGRRDKRPLVLKAGGGNAALHAFRAELGTALARNGLGRCVSRTFEPHVTLAYAAQTVDAEAVTPITWTAQDFVLVHSLLGQTRHVVLGRWALEG